MEVMQGRSKVLQIRDLKTFNMNYRNIKDIIEK